jgi:hypothetical protein
LIASQIFQSLPDSPAPAPAEEAAMDVDTSTEAPPTSATTSTVAKKFTPPINATTGDLLPECTAYIRLLLILANLDAGHIEQVRFCLQAMLPQD